MKRVLAICGSPNHWEQAETRPYEEALRAAGIETVLVYPNSGAFPGDASGLLLMGGPDVNPALYGEVRRAETEASDDARDALEFTLIATALARDLPVLAICRGLQILNVQHGGTLVQHLPSTERHSVTTADRALPAHRVTVTAGTRLAEIAAGHLTLEVNSRHHQAIGRLGDGLRISARDPEDGVIEAIERPDRRFVVAVQWHPENQSGRDERQARLFQAFAAIL